MLTHLARRMVVDQLAASSIEDPSELFDTLALSFPTWGPTLMGVSLVLCLLLMVSIEYTLSVIFNLAIVESPTSATVAIYKPVSEDVDAPLEKKDSDMSYDVEIETATVSGRPITHSIKKTVTHLQSIGGFRARWRGYRVYALYCLVTGLVNLFVAHLPIPGAPFLATFAAAVAGARLHCAWTHATITMPSNKRLRSRLVSRKMVRHLAVPNILKVLATEFSVALIALNVCLSVNRIHDIIDAGNNQSLLMTFWILAPFVTTILSSFVFIGTANIVLIRCEASMLSEEDETIVPVDRTFGGRLTRVGEVLSIQQALSSFSNESWARFLKLYVKCIFITIGLIGFTFELMLAEAWMIMGDDFLVMLAAIQVQLSS